MGWAEERTLFCDINAIVIGYYGRNQMLQVMQGLDPKGDARQQQPRPNGKIRTAPDPTKLKPLTPAAFDAMFPGKSTPAAKAAAKPATGARQLAARRGR